MSREIKFRVWDKDVCAYIDRRHTFDFTNYLRLNFDEGNGIAIDSLCPGRYIYEQDTDLKDKNGKKICVGDIVSEHNGDFLGEIIQKHSGEYCIAWIGIFGGSSVLYDELSMCEVVGNIHDNPELLGDKE